MMKPSPTLRLIKAATAISARRPECREGSNTARLWDELENSLDVFEPLFTAIRDTAELEDASLVELEDGQAYLTGFVYNDKLGRFDNGRRIYTSGIADRLPLDRFLTNNGNVYRVTSWATSQ